MRNPRKISVIVLLLTAFVALAIYGLILCVNSIEVRPMYPDPPKPQPMPSVEPR